MHSLEKSRHNHAKQKSPWKNIKDVIKPEVKRKIKLIDHILSSVPRTNQYKSMKAGQLTF